MSGKNPSTSGEIAAPPRENAAGDQGALFPPTRWSVLQSLSGGERPEALRALEQLCNAYWQPLYIYLRRRGLDREQAADDVQGFFHHLLSREILNNLLPGHGRFRTFMLTALRNWRIDRHRAAVAQRRGGEFVLLSVEDLSHLDQAALAAAGDTPEDAFDRRWARTLYDAAMSRTRSHYAARGREALFERLSGMFTSRGTGPHDSIAAELGMTRGAVKQAALEMRRLFGSLLRAEVSQTVSSPEEVDGELRHLISLLK